MKKVLITLVAVLVCAGTVAFAADTATVNVSATVAATAKLTVGSATVSFADADPDLVTKIPATEGAITIDAKGKTSFGGTLDLVVAADGPLTSGTDTIAISAVKWTVSGAGFAAGTMNISDVAVGSWTNSGSHTGTQTYTLDNSWAYVTGNYTAVFTYTLTAA